MVPATPSYQEQKREPLIVVEDGSPYDLKGKSLQAGTDLTNFLREIFPDLEAAFLSADSQSAQPWMPLSAEELQQLESCETIIRKGLETFVEVGRNLAIVRDQKLYRGKYPTFDAYVEFEWHFSKQRASQLISASDVHAILSTRIEPSKLPTSERAMRELMKAPEDKRADVLEEAARGGKPTTDRIASARAKIVPGKSKGKKEKAPPPVRLETALSSAATWCLFLTQCEPSKLSEEERKSVLVVQDNLTDVFAKLNLTA